MARKAAKAVTKPQPAIVATTSSIPAPALEAARDPGAGKLVVWNDPVGRRQAMAAYYEEVGSRQQVVRRAHVATASSAFQDIGGSGRSMRDGFDREDYEQARHLEAIPKTFKGVMKASIAAYEEVGVIRNTFDLSADLAVQGIDLEHPKDSEERFYKEWFRRVRGIEISNAFVTILFAAGQVPVHRRMARLSAADERRFRRTQAIGDDTAQADADMPVPKDIEPARREIPIDYTFLNPLSVSLGPNENLATFLGEDQFRYYLDIPPEVIKVVRKPKTPEDKEFVAGLPADLLARIKAGGSTIPLRKDRVACYYYKRLHWQPWASPPIKAILPDLALLKKMKLADLAALDGAVSNIRVWKVGSLEHDIIAPPAVLQRLAAMLADNVGGGVMDFVWGPDITLEETSTEVYRFLGSTKYEPVLNAIFQGLGIPPSLYGSGQGGQQGFTNNSLSMRTFVERLQYVREVLRRFWDTEIRIVQKAMGFKKPASLTFDGLFTDQAQERQLYIDLADRDIISLETVQERFGTCPEIEAIRIKKQMRAQKKGTIPQKASPFHSANTESELKKILAQTGDYSAEELAVPLEKGGKDDAPNTRKAKVAQKYPPPQKEPEQGPGGEGGGVDPSAKPKGQPGQGRPQGKKDKKKRKQKVVKPRAAKADAGTLVRHLARASAGLADIARVTTPIYLKTLGKKTARELTEAEGCTFEAFKFALLCQFGPTEAITAEAVLAKTNAPMPVPAFAASLLNDSLKEHVERAGSPARVEMLRQYQSTAYALYCAAAAATAEANAVGVSPDSPPETEA